MAGVRTAFVKVLLSTGETLQREITKLVFGHNDAEDDTCIISLQSTDINFIDNRGFNKRAKLIVTWGYIGDPKTQQQVAYIRDTESDYQADGVTLTLHCTDKLSLAKNNRSNKVTSGSVGDVVDGILAENGVNNGGLIVGDDESNPYMLVTTSWAEEAQANLPQIDPAIIEQTQLSGTQLTTELVGEGKRVYELRQQNFRDYWNAQMNVNSAGGSSISALQKELEEIGGGEYMLTGHGDSATVKKRNLNQAPIKAFEYRKNSHTVIDFSHRTNHRRLESDSASTEVQYWDPDSNTAKAINVGALEDNSDRLGKVEDYEYALGYLGYDVPGAPSPDDEKEPYDPKFNGKLVTHIWDHQITQEGFFDNQVRDHTIVAKKFIVPRKQVINSSARTEAQAFAEALRNRSNSNLLQQSATLTIQGDVDMLSGLVVELRGLAQIHNGNYYIDKATHEVSPGHGYTVKLELARNSSIKPLELQTDTEGKVPTSVGNTNTQIPESPDVSTTATSIDSFNLRE